MEYTSKIVNVLRDEGPIYLMKEGIPFLYDRHIAPRLPRAKANHNGVTVKSARIFDSKLSWRDPNKPVAESGLVQYIDEYVQVGDQVVIVGGGWGVTTTKAAQKVGESGSVIVYEGSLNDVKKLKETLKLNNVSERVEINHCIVGPAIYLRDKPENADRIDPKDLPKCDVLELDCEGAEKEILENIDSEPRSILVETHGKYDSPSQPIERILTNLGYQIESKVVAEERKSDYCIEHDIYAIAGVKNLTPNQNNLS